MSGMRYRQGGTARKPFKEEKGSHVTSILPWHYLTVLLVPGNLPAANRSSRKHPTLRQAIRFSHRQLRPMARRFRSRAFAAPIT